MKNLLLACLLLTAALSGEKTLSIVKPDAVKSQKIGDILSLLEKNGLRIAALKMTKLTPEEAAAFYHVHRDRPFFKDLITFMSSGPIVVSVLEGEEAVPKYRALMGATDPKEAKPGTLRALFAASKSENAVHGSDSIEAAREEIAFFFDDEEIY